MQPFTACCGRRYYRPTSQMGMLRSRGEMAGGDQAGVSRTGLAFCFLRLCPFLEFHGPLWFMPDYQRIPCPSAPGKSGP